MLRGLCNNEIALATPDLRMGSSTMLPMREIEAIMMDLIPASRTLLIGSSVGATIIASFLIRHAEFHPRVTCALLTPPYIPTDALQRTGASVETIQAFLDGTAARPLNLEFTTSVKTLIVQASDDEIVPKPHRLVIESMARGSASIIYRKGTHADDTEFDRVASEVLTTLGINPQGSRGVTYSQIPQPELDQRVLLRVLRSAHGKDFYGERLHLSRILESGTSVFVALDTSSDRAIAVGYRDFQQKWGAVAVHPRYQGKGVGTQLLQQAMNDDPDFAELTLPNSSMHKAFLRAGFRRVTDPDRIRDLGANLSLGNLNIIDQSGKYIRRSLRNGQEAVRAIYERGV